MNNVAHVYVLSKQTLNYQFININLIIQFPKNILLFAIIFLINAKNFEITHESFHKKDVIILN